MKIIDSKHDFYDFYQNIYRDDSLTFDRRGSFIYDKKWIKDRLSFDPNNRKRSITNGKITFFYYQNEAHEDYEFTLQICNTFWFIKATPTKIIRDGDKVICDKYKLELISTWKDYDIKRTLIKISETDPRRSVFHLNKNGSVNQYYRFIDIKRYEECEPTWMKYSDNDDLTVDSVPILRETGISSCVDTLDVFLAFEEYFSLEKSSMERRESIDYTDTEKISSHGFNLKTSFRGKNK